MEVSPALEQSPYENAEDGQDEEFEWECSGGQRLDKSGIAVDKYYRREVPLQLDDCYQQQPEEKELEWMATKPWLGAIVPPTNLPHIDKSAPADNLSIDYVYGYRAIDSRNNVFYTAKSNEIVYMTAALGIVLNTDTNTQRFFGGGDKTKLKGHDDDITALAVHPNKQYVATGQVGKDPLICVWEVKDCSLLAKFRLGKDTRAVKCLGFSKDGRYLAAVGDDNDHTVAVWEWEDSHKVASIPSGAEAILDLNFCSTKEGTFATVGKRGVSFWTIAGKSLTCKKGIFGSQKMTDMYCCEWLSNGNCISGALNGSIYVWSGNQCIKTIKAHTGLISTISAIPGGVITGGKDNLLIIYTEEFKEIRRLKVPSCPKALDQDGQGNFVVGLRDGTIAVYANGTQPKVVMSSHSDGEAWGLAICPNTGYILTTADDNKVMVWDPVSRKCVASGILNSVAGPKARTMGASTLSIYPPNQCGRAVAINPRTGHVAIGINNGELSIRKSLKELDRVVTQKHDAKEWIEAIHYSPCGEYLAVGSHDNVVYIYDNTYKLKAKCKKHSSFITSLDWSVDSNFIQSTCGAYELLFFDAHNGTQQTGGATALRDEPWTNWTSRIGWPVQGIYPSGVDGSHINGIDRNHSGDLVATGDDWRLVNLLRYPCLKGGKPVSFAGHSEHVVRVKFDAEDKHLFSIGGYDRTLIQWKLN
jgi:WD40 repeat protein